MPTLTSPTNQGSYYLARMHGFLIPPVTGDYLFWIASKGSSEFWFSTNADSAGLQRIAFVPNGRASNPGQWDKYPTQASGPIHLEAGQPCLFDVMHEQRAGRDDTASVAWQGPGLARQVIDGRFLVPYSNHNTNGIIREFWNDYLLASLQPLTAGEVENVGLVVANPRIEIIGESPFPSPMPVEIGVALSPAQNFRWAEVEGTVGFVAKGLHDLTLELVQDHAHIELKLPATAKLNLTDLVGMRVRARGVCEARADENGNQTAGVVWVPSEKEFSETGTDAENLQKLKPVSIGELDPANPALASGRRIRIRGTIIQQDGDKVIVQGTARCCGYVSTNGTDWKSVAPPVDILMHDSALGGFLASSYKSAELTTARFDSVSGVDASAQDLEISTVAPVGKTVVQSDGKFIVQGAGTGFGSTFERFHYFSEPLAEKMEIIARLTSLESHEAESTAGIMMRDSIDPFASFASLTLNAGGGGAFHFRQGQGERDETISLNSCPVPCWLKLTRSFPTVEVRVEKKFSASVGKTVDLIGSLQWDGNRAFLANVRRLDERAAISSTNSSAENSDVAVPVHISQLVPERGEGLRQGSGSIIVRGVVTFNGPAFGTNYLILQDETAGALVRLTVRFARRSPGVGQRIELEMKSQNGKWPFPLDPNRMQVIGPARMPELVNLATANTQARRGEFRRVECQGIVREANPGEGLKLVTRTGEMPVWVSGATDAELACLVDALVRIRGVLVYRDSKTSLLAPSPAGIEVLEPAPSDPFAIPTITIDGLKDFARQASSCHRIKISGVVTYKNDGLLVIQDDTSGVQLKMSVPSKIAVGNSVEAVGFPDGQPGSLSLSQALVRKGGNNSPPAAVAISGEELYSGAYGAKIVRLAGELLGQKIEDGNQILELQSGQRIVRAEFLNRHSGFKSIPAGSQVQVTGVSRPERIGNAPVENAGGDSATASFSVLLRTPEDVAILQLPPWWVWRHAAAIIGALGFVLVVAMLWIRYLRLKVARRTRQLNEAMSKLERETEASATLAERNRLAGEIHDGLEQGLSAVMMQLDGLESKLPADPAGVARHLELARSMVRFSRTEVRHSLWDWKSPALTDKDLGSAIGDIAKQMNNGNEARVTVQVSGKAVALPTAIEHHLLRIAQEALNNAFKYSAASTINISLDYGGENVRLVVRDNGRGFDTEHVLGGSNGHFGLQNLKSRARKIGGTLKIDSVVGSGTIIEATVPVTLTPPKSNGNGQNFLA